MFPTDKKIKTLTFFTVVLIIIGYQWFFTSGKMETEWSRGQAYYDVQSRAFLSGQLHLLRLPPPELLALSDPYDYELNRHLVDFHDVTLYNGKYYLNWGPVPAVLIAVFHLLFTTQPIHDSFIVFGFLCGLLVFNTLLLLWLWDHIFPQLPGWAVILAIFLVGLSHPIPWLLGRPAIYEAAIAGGQFFLISGLYWGLSALEKSPPHFGRLLPAGTSWGLVVGTRIPLLVTVLFFTAVLMYILLRRSRKSRFRLDYVFASSCILYPFLLILLVIGAYNYSRFGSVLETGVQYTLTGGLNQNRLAREGKLVSSEYILPNLTNYMGNRIGFRPLFPYLKPLPGNSPANKIPNFNFQLEVLSGIVWALPFILFSLIPIGRFFRFLLSNMNPKGQARFIRTDAGSLRAYIPFLFGGGALFAFLPLLTFYGATMRYQADFAILLMLLSIWGFWSAVERSNQSAIKRWGAAAMGLALAAASLVAASLLGMTSYGKHFETRNPDFIYRVQGALAVRLPFFLTEEKRFSYHPESDLVWQNKDVFLWKWENDFRFYLAAIVNPNELETVSGKRFFWMGGGPTHMWIASSRSGVVELTLDTTQGPSLPDVLERQLRIRLPDGVVIYREVLPGQISLAIPVQANKMNVLTIQVLDRPTVQILPNGDTRPLLLGVRDVTFHWLE